MVYGVSYVICRIHCIQHSTYSCIVTSRTLYCAPSITYYILHIRCQQRTLCSINIMRYTTVYYLLTASNHRTTSSHMRHQLPSHAPGGATQNGSLQSHSRTCICDCYFKLESTPDFVSEREVVCYLWPFSIQNQVKILSLQDETLPDDGSA